MKSLLKIAIVGCISLISLCAQAQEVAKNSTFTPASSTNRWKLDGNATGMGQVNNIGVFGRFALFSELSALTNGAATSVNSKTVSSGTTNIVLTSDDLTEGATNLYSTPARIRAALSATGPIQLSAGVFSMPAATNSVDGYLTAIDRSAFNAKEPAIPAGTAAQYIAANKTVGTFSPTTVGLGNVTNNAQVINAGGVVSFGGGTLASRPAAGTANRYYVATDNGTVYLDNGTAWVLAITPAGIGAASVSSVIPVNFVSTYAGLSGVAAPAAGFLKFVQVGTDGQYTETDDIFIIKPSGKIHKIPLNPADN